MIAVSEIAVAVLSSAFVAAAVMLLVYVLMRAARGARALLPDDLLERTGRLGASIGRDLVGDASDQPGATSSLDRRCGVAIGGCLVVSATVRLVATFVPLYRAVPYATRSFTLSSGMHYDAIIWYVEIGLSVAIGWLAFRWRNGIITAVVVGYCAPAIGLVALYAAFFTLGGDHLGPAYYLLQLADVLEAVAFVIAVVAIAARTADRARPRGPSVGLGVLAALLVAVSGGMNLTRVRGMSLWSFGSFGSLSSRAVPAIVVGLVVVALIPLLAIRLGRKTASFVVLGVGVETALSVADAALSRLGLRFPFELTIGFWLTFVASAVLFVLVGSLRHEDRTTPVVPVLTAIG